MSAWLLDIDGNWHEANGNIENIARDFNNYFDINIGNAEEDRKSKVMKIDINMKLKNSSNNETLNYTALIGA